MFKMKIGGVTYEVSVVDGVTTYNPPLKHNPKWDANIKDMVDSQTAPGLQSDTGWHAGRGTLLQQMDGDENWCKHITQQAAKQGYTVGANDVYIGQLADFAGDRKAFFKPSEGRAELIKRCKASGKGVQAVGVNVEASAPAERAPVKLNPRIARNMARSYVASGEAAGMSESQLLKHVTDKHGRKD